MQTEGPSGSVPECSATQKGEEIPRGMVVTTSDLQMRSLYGMEDEEQVSRKVFDIDFPPICGVGVECSCNSMHLSTWPWISKSFMILKTYQRGRYGRQCYL